MGNMGMADSEHHEKMMRLGQQRDAVPARRPVDDALDRLPDQITDAFDAPTVREALERLREERDGLRWQLDDLRRQAMEMKEQGIWPVSKVVEHAEAAEAEAEQLREERDAARKQSREASEMYVQANEQITELLQQESFMERKLAAQREDIERLATRVEAAESENRQRHAEALAFDNVREAFDDTLEALRQLREGLRPLLDKMELASAGKPEDFIAEWAANLRTLLSGFPADAARVPAGEPDGGGAK